MPTAPNRLEPALDLGHFLALLWFCCYLLSNRRRRNNVNEVPLAGEENISAHKTFMFCDIITFLRCLNWLIIVISAPVQERVPCFFFFSCAIKTAKKKGGGGWGHGAAESTLFCVPPCSDLCVCGFSRRGGDAGAQPVICEPPHTKQILCFAFAPLARLVQPAGDILLGFHRRAQRQRLFNEPENEAQRCNDGLAVKCCGSLGFLQWVLLSSTPLHPFCSCHSLLVKVSFTFAHRSHLSCWLWMTRHGRVLLLCVRRLFLKMQATDDSPVTSTTSAPNTTAITKSREQILIQSKGMPNLSVCACACFITSVQANL